MDDGTAPRSVRSLGGAEREHIQQAGGLGVGLWIQQRTRERQTGARESEEWRLFEL